MYIRHISLFAFQVDFMPTAQFVLFIMSRLCAPARDDALTELKKETQLIPLFKLATIFHQQTRIPL